MSIEGEPPAVAALIATMDRPTFVRDAIASVCEQTYAEMEVIVVDASTDTQTERIVDEFASNNPELEWRYIHNETPQGLPAARNRAAAATDANFLSFLDDDDQWRPEKVAKQVALLRENEKLGLVHTGYEGRDERGRVVSSHSPEYDTFSLTDILGWNTIMTPSTVMVRREPFERVDGFDEELHYCADWDFYIRMAQECQFDCLPETLVDRAYHEGSMMNDLDQFFEFRERVIQKHEGTLQSRGMAEEVWKRHYRKTAESYLQAGRRTAAKKTYRASLSRKFDLRTAVAYLFCTTFPTTYVLPMLRRTSNIEGRIRTHERDQA